jgi:hypothetical protein
MLCWTAPARSTKGGGTHIVRECQQFKRAFHAPEDPKRPKSDGDRSSSHRYNNNRRDD